MQTRVGLLVRLAFAVVALEAVVSVPKLSWDLSVNRAALLGGIMSLLAAATALLVVWNFRARIDAGIRALTIFSGRMSTARWLLLCSLTGITLRLFWVLLFPAPRRSDYATYFELARSLYQNHSYILAHGGYAYWPPGYPFYLSSFFFVFGVHDWIPLVANLLSFVGAIAVAYQLAIETANAGAGRLATLLLVLWPAFVSSAGLASKELLILFLLPAALLAYIRSADSKAGTTRFLWPAMCGAALGLGSLAQPSLLLFPIVLLAYDWLRHAKWTAALLRLGTVAVIMMIVILPWTLRNHRILGHWILISTNGGDVFYRANNPLATGGYISAGPIFSNLDEIEAGKLGYQSGEQWIRTHPASFLSLAVRKEVLFLGDDAHGVYETLKRGLGIGGFRYALLKGLANLFWWLLWIVIFVRMVALRNQLVLDPPAILLLMLSFLYLFCIHSIFESNGRYHLPLLVVLVVLASWMTTAGPAEKHQPSCEEAPGLVAAANPGASS